MHEAADGRDQRGSMPAAAEENSGRRRPPSITRPRTRGPDDNARKAAIAFDEPNAITTTADASRCVGSNIDELPDGADRRR